MNIDDCFIQLLSNALVSSWNVVVRLLISCVFTKVCCVMDITTVAMGGTNFWKNAVCFCFLTINSLLTRISKLFIAHFDKHILISLLLGPDLRNILRSSYDNIYLMIIVRQC